MNSNLLWIAVAVSPVALAIRIALRKGTVRFLFDSKKNRWKVGEKGASIIALTHDILGLAALMGPLGLMLLAANYLS